MGVMFPAFASAGDVYKCVTDDSVTYQNMPCAGGQIQARLPKLPGYADPPERDTATSPTAAPSGEGARDPAPRPIAAAAWPVSQRGFPFRTTIGIGMTDDQVLNTPQWGRPDRIVRSRLRRHWNEHWTYARADGARALWFTDGKLTTIETGVGVGTPVLLATAAAPGVR